MPALTDPRPHVFIEAQSEDDDHLDAAAFGRLIRQLLDAHPDIELTTIRLWKHAADGAPTLRVDARRGQITECSSCHQPADRPHTEYCRRPNREYPGQPEERKQWLGHRDLCPLQWGEQCDC